MTPTLRLRIVPSSGVPGAVSIRPIASDDIPYGTLQRALTDAGFKPGDIVELRVVEPEPGPEAA